MITIVDTIKGLRGKWNRDYVYGLGEVFDSMNIEYQEVYSPYPNELLKQLLDVPIYSTVWFVNYDNDIARTLRYRRPDLVLLAHAHGTKTMLFEPGFIHGGQVFAPEKPETIEAQTLSPYDAVFCNSMYQKSFIPEEFFDKVFVTGFPVPVNRLKSLIPMRDKDEKSVLFSQRFSFEKNLPFAIMVAERLIHDGYSVKWSYGERTGDFVLLSDYVEEAKRVGIDFTYCPSKAEYYSLLGSSEYVLTTSCYDTLSLSMVEGSIAECKCIAPKNMCFPEYMSESNLYDPYSIKDCLRAFESATVQVDDTLFNNAQVVCNMLRVVRSKGIRI